MTSSKFTSILMLLIITRLVVGNPRLQTVELICTGNATSHNASTSAALVRNFIATVEAAGDEVLISGYGAAVNGGGSVYVLAQCYGDLSAVDCAMCYAEARTLVPLCFTRHKTRSRLFLDGCFLRTDSYRFFEDYSGEEDRAVCGNATKRRGSAFREAVVRAVRRAVSVAPGRLGFAGAEAAVLRESAYVLANCWRTLNASDCRVCLDNAAASVLRCLPWSEGRALNTGCFMRYSNTNFLNPKLPEKKSNGGITMLVVLLAIVSSVVVLAVVAAICIMIWKHRVIQKRRGGSNAVKKLVKNLSRGGLNFKFSALDKATQSFHEENKLWHDVNGTVYKGILGDGREIAVKRLLFNNTHTAGDFYNEVKSISSMDHKNLVRLLGCSCSRSESLLVYEFLPNQSLDRFIFDPEKGKMLNWEKRCEIILGTAEGLLHLLENTHAKIIHRDIKAGNILLDSKFQAKIANFGFAGPCPEDNSKISTNIAGTPGYMAPEYVTHGLLTEKANIYSFGVLLLEITMGRQNNSSKVSEFSDSLVITAWAQFHQGTMEELVDPNLLCHSSTEGISESIKKRVLRVMHIGLLCTQETPLIRPTMSKVFEMLTKEDGHLPAPTHPAFIDKQAMFPLKVTEFLAKSNNSSLVPPRTATSGTNLQGL